MLGTGSAFPSRSYNECFVVETGEGRLLVDGGGGNSIIRILDDNGIDIAELDNMFVTHTHTDHIFGAVWIIRRIVQLSLENKYDSRFKVFGNADVVHALREICRLTFLDSYFIKMNETVVFETVKADEVRSIASAEVKFIDCCSENVAQTGFVMKLMSGTTLACLGDEALTERNATLVSGADYLICGAFCRYADRDIFRPYEKHHLTVRDVAETASRAGIGNLILVHCEDRMPGSRQELYADEAGEFFHGKVIVPEDGSVIPLS